MPELDFGHLPSFHSAEEILAHPQFSAARNALLGKMLELYEHDPFLNRLLLETGRNTVFVVIMCLHATYDEADRATWPTLKAVTEAMAGFSVGSPRRVADLVSRLVKTGYLEQLPAPIDRRVRILKPTQKMILQDQDWLESHYIPLQVLFPNPGYAFIMQRHPAFHLTQRVVSRSLFPLAAQIMARNPTMMQFMCREAGMMIIIKLMRLAGPNPEMNQEIAYSDIGARFGVSRTQVRKLLQEAEKIGLVRLTRAKAQMAQLTPMLIEIFDRFIADGMSGHDLVYQLALRAA